jgi:hypothetical protein
MSSTGSERHAASVGCIAIACAVLVAACDPRGADRAGDGAWPGAEFRLSVEMFRGDAALRASVPACRMVAPVVTPDSIGPVRAGQSLAQLLNVCPDPILGWVWTHDGSALPALATRLGSAIVVALLTDTVAAAIVAEAMTADLGTAEGIGSGSSLDDVVAVYGEGELVAGDCELEVIFDARPGLSFVLHSPAALLTCEEVTEIADENTFDRVPPDALVAYIVQYPRR